MPGLFRTVVRWAAAVLIAVPAGGYLVAVTGQTVLTTAIGGLMLLVGGVFVAASVATTHWGVASRIGRRPTRGVVDEVGELAGPGLFRAVFLGLAGAGLLVGARSPSGPASVVALAAGVMALALTSAVAARRHGG